VSTDAVTPELLQDAMQDWDALAFLAYDGFVRAGRGVLALEQVPEDVSPVRVRASYVTFGERGPHPETARVVSEYDPDTEFVLLYRDPIGGECERGACAPDLRHVRPSASGFLSSFEE
jgi:hypothetical protein